MRIIARLDKQGLQFFAAAAVSKRLVVSEASLSGSVGREWLAWGGKSMKIRLFLTLGRWKHVQSELGPRLD